MAVDRDGPKAFILAPDGEFSSLNIENDQVWSLNLDATDIYPFYLQTTYHLQAKSMRLFPNIIVDHHRLTQPEDFIMPPTVTSYTPGTIQIEYRSPHPLAIQFTGFLLEAEVLVGSIGIENTGSEPMSLDCEIGALLVPMGKGSPTHPHKIGNNHIITGQTDGICPVLMMSSGPTGTSNPYPALCVSLKIDPGQSEMLHWVLVSKKSQEISLETAREYLSSTWQKASQSQIKAHDRNRIYIKTGEPDWDSTFLLAQVNALTHLVGPDWDENQPAFIRTRLPDNPIGVRPEDEPLDDLTLLDVLHLAQVILPPYTEHLTHLVERFSVRVDEDGCLPSYFHRGLNGLPINECPLLANLCLILFEINQDYEFLRRVFPHLQRFFTLGWLKDQDPIDGTLPHWESPEQLQLDMGLFNFDIWEVTGKGLDIRTAESPALAAMLHREASALQKIADILGNRSARHLYNKIAKALNEKIISLWDEEPKVFTYRDRQSNLSPERELYYPGLIKPKIYINKTFNHPQRLHVHLITNDENTRACVVDITGRNQAGETIVEQHRSPGLHWILGHAHITTQNLFSTLDEVTFEGFNTDDRFLIETADYSQADISCLLPIWTGHINKEILSALIENQLDLSAPDFSSGIPEALRRPLPTPDLAKQSAERPARSAELRIPEGLVQQVNILWNTLIIDGLVREGFTENAVKIFTNLMSAIIHGLKDYNGFYSAHEVVSGYPKGQPNAIPGLAPVGLFLKIVGIKLLSPNQVVIWDSNPFPWPIEVRWQGLWVRREGEQTHIIFPDGTQYQSQATKPLVVKSAQG